MSLCLFCNSDFVAAKDTARLVDKIITINNATINGGKFAGNMNISTGGNITYADNKVLLAYTGSVGNPIIMPNGGDIGNSTSKFNICGVTLTGGDFQKLKNLQ